MIVKCYIRYSERGKKTERRREIDRRVKENMCVCVCVYVNKVRPVSHKRKSFQMPTMTAAYNSNYNDNHNDFEYGYEMQN